MSRSHTGGNRWCSSSCCGPRSRTSKGPTPTSHATASHGSNPAPLLSRYFTAISLGYLPSNDQLYAALHAWAGALEGAAQSVGGDEREAAADRQDSVGADVDVDVGRSAKLLLQENAEAAREVARWLYGDVKDVRAASSPAAGHETAEEHREDADVDGKAEERLVDLSDAPDQQQSERSSAQVQAQHHHSSAFPASTSTSTSSRRDSTAPRGNSNEQLQRLVWLLRGAYNDVDREDGNLDVDVHLG